MPEPNVPVLIGSELEGWTVAPDDLPLFLAQTARSLDKRVHLRRKGSDERKFKKRSGSLIVFKQALNEFQI
jgi:hypothetical protein